MQSHSLRELRRVASERLTVNKRAVFMVVGMNCIRCASIMDKVLNKTHGVHAVNVNYMTDTAYVDYDPSQVSPEEIEETLKKTRYRFVRRRDLEL